MVVNKVEAGFTLMEMLVALALASLVSTGLMSVYWSANHAFNRLSDYSDTQYGARSAIQRIVEDVRMATQAPVVKESNTKLVLTTPGGTVEYYRNAINNNLYRRSGGTAVPVAENITDLKFSNSVSPLKITVEAAVRGNAYRLSSGASYRVGGGGN
jgi:prepilin-type N-terminal cleavage/methylation domain-containing protein